MKKSSDSKIACFVNCWEKAPALRDSGKTTAIIVEEKTRKNF